MSRDAALDVHILNIVQSESIQEQSELQDKLQARGYDVPQATLSRRLKKLKIAKIAGQYQLIEFQQPTLPMILNLQISDTGIIIIHTLPGNANSIASYLDHKYITFSPTQTSKSPMLGTIAGDDTLMIILKSPADSERTLSLLREDFPYLEQFLTHCYKK